MKFSVKIVMSIIVLVPDFPKNIWNRAKNPFALRGTSTVFKRVSPSHTWCHWCSYVSRVSSICDTLSRCVVSESQVHAHWGTYGCNHCHVSLKICCSYLWCRMSSHSANTIIHGRVICNNEYAFGVCIEMEWLWVTMTNSSNWWWQKQVGSERVVRYSSVHHQ